MKVDHKKFDVVVLTEKKYLHPIDQDDYIRNLLLEDNLIADALIKKGLRVTRVNWDSESFDWSEAKHLLVRSTWDYSDRIDEFLSWMDFVSTKCRLINPFDMIKWNIDKRYLEDIENEGVRIVPTHFTNRGNSISLKSILQKNHWNDTVIKPVISCGGRETYKVLNSEIENYESIYSKLVQEEAMMVQPFISSIETKGEISLMVFGGKFSHAILKKAKPGDFRVQDDFGGTVHHYTANENEIAFAENVVKACKTLPFYARVDAVWDDEDRLCVSELELIEPELWFRNKTKSATVLAEYIVSLIQEK